jgi:hypothetical protein
VTVHAIGGSSITGRHPLSMHAGLIKGELIHTLLGLELMDQVSITVTTGTELGHSRARNFPQESAGSAHGRFGVVQIPISTMTIGTAKPSLLVDVDAESLPRDLKVTFKCRVTGNTGIVGFRHHRFEK